MKIYRWHCLTEQEQTALLMRPAMTDQPDVRVKTAAIIKQVKEQGDQALNTLTADYDRVQLEAIKALPHEFEAARAQVSNSERQAILFAKKQIAACHSAQMVVPTTVETCEGVYCSRQYRPIERVGLYVPGGSAPLISTALMLAVPAQLAGCALRLICTPPNAQGEIDPRILVAAELCGVEHVYKVGGAQAIAAMAYGTESVPKVDKIFGPGNVWATEAKSQVAQDIHAARIDMAAGPSELFIIADGLADPDFVAADLLSQAEHGADSQVLLATCSMDVAERVRAVIGSQLMTLPRRDIAKKALAHGRIILVDHIEEAISLADRYAPEHLSLQIQEDERYVPLIKHAGAIFIGKWTPEVVGDYVTGANHVLPTYGLSRAMSGLSLMDFMKCISVQKVTAQGMRQIGPIAEKLADIEGLGAHKHACSLRLKTISFIAEQKA